jgi:hypothetical protein
MRFRIPFCSLRSGIDGRVVGHRGRCSGLLRKGIHQFAPLRSCGESWHTKADSHTTSSVVRSLGASPAPAFRNVPRRRLSGTEKGTMVERFVTSGTRRQMGKARVKPLTICALILRTSNSMKGPDWLWRSPSASAVKVREGVDEGKVMRGARRVVAADRTAAADEAAAFPLSGSQAAR